jgi:hypothetical protein
MFQKYKNKNGLNSKPQSKNLNINSRQALCQHRLFLLFPKSLRPLFFQLFKQTFIAVADGGSNSNGERIICWHVFGGINGWEFS